MSHEDVLFLTAAVDVEDETIGQKNEQHQEEALDITAATHVDAAVTDAVINGAPTIDEAPPVLSENQSESTQPQMGLDEAMENNLKCLFKNTRYFLIKSTNHENVHLAKSKGVWSTPRLNEIKLNKAYRECSNVILIFSVAESGRFQGYARLASHCQRDPDMQVNWVLPPTLSARSLASLFKIDWITKADLFFPKTQHLQNSWNDMRPVKIGRDGQEIEPKCGEQLCRLFDLFDTGMDAPEDQRRLTFQEVSEHIEKIVEKSKKRHLELAERHDKKSSRSRSRSREKISSPEEDDEEGGTEDKKAKDANGLSKAIVLTRSDNETRRNNDNYHHRDNYNYNNYRRRNYDDHRSNNSYSNNHNNHHHHHHHNNNNYPYNHNNNNNNNYLNMRHNQNSYNNGYNNNNYHNSGSNYNNYNNNNNNNNLNNTYPNPNHPIQMMNNPMQMPNMAMPNMGGMNPTIEGVSGMVPYGQSYIGAPNLHLPAASSSSYQTAPIIPPQSTEKRNYDRDESNAKLLSSKYIPVAKDLLLNSTYEEYLAATLGSQVAERAALTQTTPDYSQSQSYLPHNPNYDYSQINQFNQSYSYSNGLIQSSNTAYQPSKYDQDVEEFLRRSSVAPPKIANEHKDKHSRERSREKQISSSSMSSSSRHRHHRHRHHSSSSRSDTRSRSNSREKVKKQHRLKERK